MIFDATGQASAPPDFLRRRRQRRVGEQHHDAQRLECIAHDGVDCGTGSHLPRFVLFEMGVGGANQVPRCFERLARLRATPRCVSLTHGSRSDISQRRITTWRWANATTLLFDHGRDTCCEVAEVVGKVRVVARNETFIGEVAVIAIRRVGEHVVAKTVDAELVDQIKRAHDVAGCL